jgi:disulfide bond formation protein DsbB
VPVFAQWLFGSDYGRYALYAFPVVVAVGAIAVWQHPRRIVLLGLVTVQSLSTVADIQIRGFQHLYQIQPSTWISLALMVLAVPILWWPTRTTAATDAALPRPRAVATA